MSEFQCTTEPVARRRHTCCECGGNIEPGSAYQRTAGCWDGTMDQFRTCIPCVNTRDWATRQPEWSGDGEHLFYFEMLADDLCNLAPEIPPGDGRRFTAYRLQIEMCRRGNAARTSKAA